MAQKINIAEVLRQSQVDALPDVHFAIQGAKDGSDLSDILSRETQLQSRFLRLVSQLHRHISQSDAVDEVVGQVGLEPAQNLLLAIIVADLFMPLGPDIVSRDDFWRHSVACAVAARALAVHRNEANAERFFVAGLLHDVGSLLIYTNISERSLLTILHGRDVERPLFELERHVIGLDHAQFGAQVLEALKLPSWLHEAVGNHHAPESPSNFPLETAVVHLADIIVNAMKLGTRGEFKVPPLTPAAWDRIGLQKEVLASLVKEVDALAGQLVPVFRHKTA